MLDLISNIGSWASYFAFTTYFEAKFVHNRDNVDQSPKFDWNFSQNFSYIIWNYFVIFYSSIENISKIIQHIILTFLLLLAISEQKN
jgi:hypothetical protein